MITLTIKKPDGSVYNVARFNNQVDCDSYLKSDQKNWSKGYSYSSVDDTPSAADIQAANDKKAKMAAAVSTVSAFDPATAKMADVISAVNAIAILQGLK